MDDTAFKGNGNCLRPITCSQFLHDVFNVNLDGLLGDEQSIGNIAVAIASGNLLQDLNLACGEVFVGIMLGQVCRDRSWNAFFPRVDCADSFHQVLGWHALQDVALRACSKRPLDFHVTFGSRQHDDAGIRELTANGHHGVDAILIWKPDIHQGYVRSKLAKPLQSLRSTGGLAHNAHVGLTIDKRGDSFPQQRMIIYGQDANTRLLAHWFPHSLGAEISFLGLAPNQRISHLPKGLDVEDTNATLPGT